MNKVERAARQAVRSPDWRNPKVTGQESLEILAKANPRNKEDVNVLRSIYFLPSHLVGGGDSEGPNARLFTNEARRQFDKWFNANGVQNIKPWGNFEPQAAFDPYGWAEHYDPNWNPGIP